ncbi:MAG TPA: cupin domain-containing protein [Ktedonobacterales bacterium]|nr:cupin domain-containing protein [Ktedonobacterales bacterium]
MAHLEKKNFNAPDERRTPPNTTIETVRFGDRTVSRVTYNPGWRWTKDVKPVVGTDLCQVNHFVYVVSGRTHVVMADGTEIELGPGDTGTVPAGHDGWVVGDEPCVFIDFGGAARPD